MRGFNLSGRQKTDETMRPTNHSRRGFYFQKGEGRRCHSCKRSPQEFQIWSYKPATELTNLFSSVKLKLGHSLPPGQSSLRCGCMCFQEVRVRTTATDTGVRELKTEPGLQTFQVTRKVAATLSSRKRKSEVTLWFSMEPKANSQSPSLRTASSICYSQ